VRVGIRTERSPNTIFHYTCNGNSSLQSTKLLLRKGYVNQPIGEVCSGVVRVAFNQWGAYSEWDPVFEVDMENEKMVEYEPCFGCVWDYEILNSFFATYELTPTWQDCNETWGWLDEETGLWNGAVRAVG
jgi:hypothetical protein